MDCRARSDTGSRRWEDQDVNVVRQVGSVAASREAHNGHAVSGSRQRSCFLADSTVVSQVAIEGHADARAKWVGGSCRDVVPVGGPSGPSRTFVRSLTTAPMAYRKRELRARMRADCHGWHQRGDPRANL